MKLPRITRPVGAVSAARPEEIGRGPGLRPAIHPSKGKGSHSMMRMCAHIQYTYKDKRGKSHYGVTRPDQCGPKFRAAHDKEGKAKRLISETQACRAARALLPKLPAGAASDCKSYQQR